MSGDDRCPVESPRAAGRFWVLVVYERVIWEFSLLALLAVLGWTAFIWCGIWAQSVPEERTGAGLIRVVVGAIGLGVGLISVIVYGAST